MTDDLAIDRALALAIGHPLRNICFLNRLLWVVSPDLALSHPEHCGLPPFLPWCRFSHKDPAVIWRIAERFDCFPYQTGSGYWITGLPRMRLSKMVCHSNPATAVALAVIAAHERSRT